MEIEKQKQPTFISYSHGHKLEREMSEFIKEKVKEFEEMFDDILWNVESIEMMEFIESKSKVTLSFLQAELLHKIEKKKRELKRMKENDEKLAETLKEIASPEKTFKIPTKIPTIESIVKAFFKEKQV